MFFSGFEEVFSQGSPGVGNKMGLENRLGEFFYLIFFRNSPFLFSKAFPLIKQMIPGFGKGCFFSLTVESSEAWENDKTIGAKFVQMIISEIFNFLPKKEVISFTIYSKFGKNDFGFKKWKISQFSLELESIGLESRLGKFAPFLSNKRGDNKFHNPSLFEKLI